MTDHAGYEALLQFLYRVPVGLVQTDAHGDIEMINPIAAGLLLPSSNGRLDNLFTALLNVAPHLRQLAADATDPGGMICEALRAPFPAGTGGHGGPEVLSISLFRLHGGRLMGVLQDATQEARREHEALSRELGAAARVDALTGLPNRLALLERLDLALRRTPVAANSGFAVFSIKFGRLTQVADAFGHAVADRLLILVIERLRSALNMPERRSAPPGSPMVAHVSDDKFIALLEEVAAPGDANRVAARLVQALAEPYLIGPAEIQCGAAIGVALRESAAATADDILRDASLAMTEAEAAGSGRYVVYDPAMQLRATRRAEMEVDLRRALTEGQFFVVYQPVVGLQGPRCADGAVDRSAGVEALVRWRHPTHGTLPPVEFIGIAEECGLIDALGEFVLRTACRQFMEWQKRLGPAAPHTVAVNLSRFQLGRVDVAALVGGILRSSGMAPDRLQLEVTESLAAQSPAVQSRLRELKALGLTLALDDFGTGYSSLSSLDQLPVDTVKIDRSFVTDSPASPRLRAVIDATIRVAHALNMTTVAEGIETEAQAAIVRGLGCDKGQGYLFSKPLPSDELVRWLTGG